jgi:hypothetical protein
MCRNFETFFHPPERSWISLPSCREVVGGQTWWAFCDPHAMPTWHLKSMRALQGQQTSQKYSVSLQNQISVQAQKIDCTFQNWNISPKCTEFFYESSHYITSSKPKMYTMINRVLSWPRECLTHKVSDHHHLHHKWQRLNLLLLLPAEIIIRTNSRSEPTKSSTKPKSDWCH